MNEGVIAWRWFNYVYNCRRYSWNSSKVFMKYKNFPNDVNTGERIRWWKTEIVETDKNTEVIARVIQGGELKSKRSQPA
jgi:pyruvate kinase